MFDVSKFRRLGSRLLSHGQSKVSISKTKKRQKPRYQCTRAFTVPVYPSCCQKTSNIRCRHKESRGYSLTKRPRTQLQIRLPSIVEEELDEDDTLLYPSDEIEYTPSGQKSPSHSNLFNIEPQSPEMSSPPVKKKARGWPKGSTKQVVGKGKKADREIMDTNHKLVFFVLLGAFKGQQGRVSMSMMTNLTVALEKIYKVMGCEEFHNKPPLMYSMKGTGRVPVRLQDTDDWDGLRAHVGAICKTEWLINITIKADDDYMNAIHA
ncbi:hypothetical protein K439DRAFT_1624149 [Ramaria rubella]|nr:hypothetical protein K439DRAFT_1624149 [Ramaria rubella]